MASFTNEELNKIRSSVNIVDVVSNYVNLEKKGKNYMCVCPFHADHNESMSVSEDKQIFSCFGADCGASGNVFSFLQRIENISFVEAVYKVSEISGIRINKDIKIEKKYDTEYKIYDLAVKYFKNNLKTELGKSALNYLKSRNISEDIINEFDIGVSFNDNNLTKLLLGKNYKEDMLVNIGLCNKKDELYDLFRNRIMFPIHNTNGDAVGFSARIYDNSVDSKYINTKETYIFKKGKILFNYHRAKVEASRLKTLILCEGQMDAIRIYSSGVKNVVATMGTALTNDHINLIKKLNSKVVLNMDSDNAGIKAAIQNGELLSQSGIVVSVLKLSGAKDPDEYISKYGVDSYKDALNHAIPLFDFKMNYLKENKDLNQIDGLNDYINSVIDELNKSNDELKRTITINKLSEDYGIKKDILLSRLKQIETVKIEPIKKVTKKVKQNIRAVKEVLYYMMNNVKYAKIFSRELNYIPDDKYFSLEKDIQAYIILNNTINLADFISYGISNNKEELINEIINSHDNDIEISDEEFLNYIEIIRKWILEEKISSLKTELKNELDINRKKELMDLITKIKRGSEENGS